MNGVEYTVDIESVLQNGFGEAELYILDDMTRKWGEYEFHPKTALYVNTSETLQTVIDEIDQRVQMRYEQFSEGQLDVLEDEPWIVLIDRKSTRLNSSHRT